MAQAQETQRAVSKWFVFWPFLGQKWFALSWFFFLWPVFDLITLKTLPSRKMNMSPYFSSSCCWYCFDATLAPVSISAHLNHITNCTNTAPHNSLPKPALCTEALPPPFLTSLSKLSRVLATQILQKHKFGEILNRWEMWDLWVGNLLGKPIQAAWIDEGRGKADKCNQYWENACLGPCLKFPKKENWTLTILTWTSLYRRRAWGYNPSYRHDPPWYASLSNSSCKKCSKVCQPVPWQNAGTLKECDI